MNLWQISFGVSTEMLNKRKQSGANFPLLSKFAPVASVI